MLCGNWRLRVFMIKEKDVEFTLVEIRVLLIGPCPIFRELTDTTSIIFGPAVMT